MNRFVLVAAFIITGCDGSTEGSTSDSTSSSPSASTRALRGGACCDSRQGTGFQEDGDPANGKVGLPIPCSQATAHDLCTFGMVRKNCPVTCGVCTRTCPAPAPIPSPEPSPGPSHAPTTTAPTVGSVSTPAENTGRGPLGIASLTTSTTAPTTSPAPATPAPPAPPLASPPAPASPAAAAASATDLGPVNLVGSMAVRVSGDDGERDNAAEALMFLEAKAGLTRAIATVAEVFTIQVTIDFITPQTRRLAERSAFKTTGGTRAIVHVEFTIADVPAANEAAVHDSLTTDTSVLATSINSEMTARSMPYTVQVQEVFVSRSAPAPGSSDGNGSEDNRETTTIVMISIGCIVGGLVCCSICAVIYYFYVKKSHVHDIIVITPPIMADETDVNQMKKMSSRRSDAGEFEETSTATPSLRSNDSRRSSLMSNESLWSSMRSNEPRMSSVRSNESRRSSVSSIRSRSSEPTAPSVEAKGSETSDKMKLQLSIRSRSSEPTAHRLSCREIVENSLRSPRNAVAPPLPHKEHLRPPLPLPTLLHSEHCTAKAML